MSPNETPEPPAWLRVTEPCPNCREEAFHHAGLVTVRFCEDCQLYFRAGKALSAREIQQAIRDAVLVHDLEIDRHRKLIQDLIQLEAAL